ncbi:MAG: hypothetical protein A3I44_04255 [Candidatus Sungbacteria bacterium RIFCSPLOWO2_02_FULL_51_17]|uniref:Signal transduction histidine kinase 5TM receptor LytS transmembrane region domain-containing protein n=1 Tax=Candidatus Sungbacteria bacterium RIFCSPHIGHO2_02_FULL_51_29 TaxID=1802273 RepID=A0A1G2KZ28_9BACT|nr:MAG: hypothetical protein A2676_02765 [Candidatus Sungbacteria bacterium RIFCSPHIGHO2_01_FULL_51_22]OHA03689.1 MAG: hypothetical protein A3C16_03575 [Candidatus Sungbacteria bacterium RIFCSPHIGHO2_02_FULL_51_29]OHA07327.1 MAG: hypothetical protein A3B29_02860 [Candidatus Sungbacteria bacterium RIFCSPLOWO2_01_FULL_51_34]OHA11290.1 MAG: hypothetical protein A3I44_04255 [Candidatus Sungbacteria bacterium RIFCSPLOWO2_02_FULL_51_17]
MRKFFDAWLAGFAGFLFFFTVFGIVLGAIFGPPTHPIIPLNVHWVLGTVVDGIALGIPVGLIGAFFSLISNR